MPFPRTIAELDAMIPDEAAAELLLTHIRWPGGRPTCPVCGTPNMTRLSTRAVWQCPCPECRKQITVRTFSGLHRTRIPLRQVVHIVWRCVSMSGASAAEIARELGLRYDTVWAIAQKVRAALVENGAWQIERAFALGTITIPVTKRAKGDPPDRPPVLVAAVVDPMPDPPDAIRYETPSRAVQTPAELCAVARHRHVHPLATPAPAPGAFVREAGDRVVGWLRRRFGGVSRKFMAGYLAQSAYTDNRAHRSEDLLVLGLRRVLLSPWRPRSELAVPSP